MNGNVVFVGGIHGVGKGTLCKKLSDKMELVHLSASEVLKWSEIKEDARDKRVESIPSTQDRLISGLSGILEAEKAYLLDGHYCLFDMNGKFSRVPIETFTTISPLLVSVVVGDVKSISSQLILRDQIEYEIPLLQSMQKEEVEYAEVISKVLECPLIVVENNDFSELSAQIKTSLT